MTENYDRKKKDDLTLHAISLFHEAMRRSRGDCSDAGAIFTICIAMCLENVDDDEDVREVLNVVGRNCLAVWREYRELKTRYMIGD